LSRNVEDTMTCWLTDCPESTGNYLEDHALWTTLSQEQPWSLHQLASWFNPGKETWIAECLANQLPFPGRVMVLVDHASTSQFDTVLDVLKQGNELPDGLVCLALTGSGFRGQRNRPWSALRGNFHLTAHYRLDEPASAIQAALTMIPAVASAEAISRVVPRSVRPGIKWVNDVYINDRKVSGVLTATHVTGGKVNCVVFGIGINVEHAPSISPTPFVPLAGCLKDASDGVCVSLPELLSHTVNLLDKLILVLKQGRSSEIFAQYYARADFIGREVRIWPEGTEDWNSVAPLICGRILGLNSDLSLHVEGQDQAVRAGRLAYESSCRNMSLP